MNTVLMIVLGIGAVVALLVALLLGGLGLGLIVCHPYLASFLVFTVGFAWFGGTVGCIFGLGLTVVSWVVIYGLGCLNEWMQEKSKGT